MWILVRAIAALGGLLFRIYRSAHQPALSKSWKQIAYSETISRNKGKTTKHCIGVKHVSGVAAVFTQERAVDRFFKAMGFSIEFQTGDNQFDSRVYLACDHPFYYRSLKADIQVRKLILELLSSSGSRRLWTDGRQLFLQTDMDLPVERCLPQLQTLAEKLTAAARAMPSRYRDPFAWRVLAVEALVWSIAGYAAGAYLDFQFRHEDFHVEMNRLFLLGLAVAFMASVALLALIAVFLKGSSRSHRILVESFFLLLFSLPTFGIQLVSDINRGADTSAEVTTRAKILKRWSVRHRSRRSTYYTYHLRLGDCAPLAKGTKDLEVSRYVYESAPVGGSIPLSLGEGRLGLRWYRSINGISVP